MPEVSQSSEQQSDYHSQTARLRSELGPNSDLARLVERVTQTRLPWVVVPGSAITRWEANDPAVWEKVSDWLAVHGVAIVRI